MPRSTDKPIPPGCAPHLSETQLAERWGCSTKLVQKLRYGGGGPQFLKLGGLVRYRVADIDAYERDALCASTSDPNHPSGAPTRTTQASCDGVRHHDISRFDAASSAKGGINE